MNQKLRKITLYTLASLIMLLSALGLSYAYMKGQIGSSATTEIQVEANTVDKFSFITGNPISFSASPSNFSAGASNLSGATTASAKLIANDSSNTATKYYYVYLNITNNNFVYSDGTTPEILLTITDPTGAAVTSLTGYTYLTSKGVSGFDITTKTGLVPIALNHEITSNNTTDGITQTWNITVTLLALDSDQSANEGKNFNANVMIQKSEFDSVQNIKVDIDPNMIPIMYATTCPVDADKDSTNGCWVKADTTNTDTNYSWYDYDNHIWANAVTVTTSTLSTYKSAAVGTPVLYADTMGYYVYVPRYSYKLFNVNADGTTYSTAQEILVNFENTSNTKSSGSSNGTYLTHPAFTFGDKELNGFWIGKFEISYTSDNTSAITSAVALTQGVTVKPSISTQTMYSLRYMTVSNLYTTMTSLSNGGGQANSNHNLSGLESTMLTNMEWGAVAYLTESVYGTCTGTKGSAVCTAQPQINSVGNTSTWGAMQTGCGPQSAGSTSSGTTCNYYNTTIGKLASTTQNIYGVYDMNGGAWEYVMGVTYDSAGTAPYYSNSGFTSGTMPNAKYYDLYPYGTTHNDASAYTRGKLGDATKEVVVSSSRTWYGSDAYFPHDNGSWFIRGGDFDRGAGAGVLAFNSSAGNAYSSYSSRVALH